MNDLKLKRKETRIRFANNKAKIFGIQDYENESFWKI